MKRGWLLALIAANLLVLVGLAFAYPHLMVAPGPLADAHAALTTDCFACHAPLRGVASGRCVACHVLPDIGLRTTRGVPLPQRKVKVSFHQELIEQDCMACHSDHQAPQLTHRSRKPFSHELLRAQAREACEGCHAAPETTLHRQVKGNCLQCHSQAHWKPATFDHAKLFALDGDHNADCVTCHVNGDYRQYTCYGCHEHSADKIRRKHQKEGIADFADCVKCHRSASDKPEGRGSGRRERD